MSVTPAFCWSSGAHGDGEGPRSAASDDLRLGEREAEREEVLRRGAEPCRAGRCIRRSLAAHREDEHALQEDDSAPGCARRAEDADDVDVVAGRSSVMLVSSRARIDTAR